MNLADVELENNYYYTNHYFDKSRIKNLFDHGYNKNYQSTTLMVFCEQNR